MIIGILEKCISEVAYVVSESTNVNATSYMSFRTIFFWKQRLNNLFPFRSIWDGQNVLRNVKERKICEEQQGKEQCPSSRFLVIDAKMTLCGRWTSFGSVEKYMVGEPFKICQKLSMYLCKFQKQSIICNHVPERMIIMECHTIHFKKRSVFNSCNQLQYCTLLWYCYQHSVFKDFNPVNFYSDPLYILFIP